jgi:hypothetical protein
VERLIQRLDSEIAQEQATKKTPPQGTITPTERPSAAPVVASTTAPADKVPVYKKWWLWTAVGVVVIGVSLGVGLGLGLSGSDTFDPTLAGFGPGMKSMALGAW